MNKILIWDLPVRMLHWLLAAAVLGAFALANLASDESVAFAWHAVLGLIAILLIGARLVWGAVGTRYARFSSFPFRPAALVKYLGGVFGRRPPETRAGHNPATSWFAAALFVGVAGLGVTGFLMGRGNEAVEEIHEALAWTVIGLVAVHVAGTLLHLVRTRENLVASMITGRKSGDAREAIPSARAGAAAVLLGLVAVPGALLVSGFDAASRQLTLPLAGIVLTIGETEVEGGGPGTAGEEAPGAERDDEAEAEDDE
jgi:cytochrome b